jgi:hypothetical protein
LGCSEDRAHRFGREGGDVGAVPGEDGEVVDGGQGCAEGGRADAARGVEQVWPAGTGACFAAEGEVYAAAQRVAVDEHGAYAAAAGGDCDGSRKGGCAGAAAAADEGEGGGGAHSPVEGIGQAVAERGLVAR